MNTGDAEIAGARTAGVIARPPVLFAAALIAGFVLDQWGRLALLNWSHATLHWVVGGTVSLVGLAIAAAGIRAFMRAGTAVPTVKPTLALVTTGVHAWSRNPIYLGMFLIYIGVGIAVRNPWIFALMLPLAITIRYGVVAREEQYLEERFGDAYREYKVRVRRWM